MKEHKSGFVNILGKPNVGKSTLMNSIMGERMSIITSKPQTTRHRIKGIFSGEDYQIVFSDTPGVIDDPAYSMQSAMNSFAWSSLDDADILLFMVDVWQEPEISPEHKEKLKSSDTKIFLVINKVDQKEENELKEIIEAWKGLYPWDETLLMSAINDAGTVELFEKIRKHLPVGPAYYSKEEYTDKSERFFVSEIVREKILLLYRKEIPYSVEVDVHWFKKDEEVDPPMIRIGADIYVERPTQKSIIIGKGGTKIKELGIAARQDIEAFLNSKVYLELIVKVKKNWRNDEQQLKRWGYK